MELLDVAEGRYTIFVEEVGHPSEEPLPIELQVALRPILDTGAACDPAGEAYRCASGSCPAARAPSLCP